MIQKTQNIPWGQFSEKHKNYIKNAPQNALNVAEGAIRSGKTIDHCIIAAMYLETCEDKIHLASGSSMPNAKLNIGECNGFGLEHLFRGRCRWGQFKKNEALFIQTQKGEKIVIFAGGGKADSYKKILGNSYGLWIATEINEHYDSDNSRESFIGVAFGRQLAAKKPFTLWDLNPCQPGDPIYSKYIDKWIGNYPGGYQYQLFTIYDNATLSEERKRQIEQRYEIGSLWYRRDILGERCSPEGAIYTSFINNEEAHYITAEEVPKDIGYICIGQDFGGHKSKHTFCATAISRDYSRIYVLRSEEYDAEGKSVEFVMGKLDQFCKGIQKRYGFVDYVFADSAEQTIINSERQNLTWSVRNSVKNEIIDRIRCTDILFTSKRIKIVKDENESLISALRSAVWDDKAPKDERLDKPGITNICPLDAFEYSWEHWIRQLSGDGG